MYRLLIVEDDPSIAAGLSYALEKEGYFVTQCRSVAEAFEVSDEVHFDLAVLDMQLPDGLGKEIGQKASGRNHWKTDRNPGKGKCVSAVWEPDFFPCGAL